MKLAEALQMRADLQRRISQLSGRLHNNARVQEGEQTPEDPEQLLMELEDNLSIVIALTEIEKEDINTPEKIVALAMQRNAEG